MKSKISWNRVASSNLASSYKKKLVHSDGLLFVFESSAELAASDSLRAALRAVARCTRLRAQSSPREGRFNREVSGIPGEQKLLRDPVASSNLAGSSKELRGFDFGVLLLL